MPHSLSLSGSLSLSILLLPLFPNTLFFTPPRYFFSPLFYLTSGVNTIVLSQYLPLDVTPVFFSVFRSDSRRQHTKRAQCCFLFRHFVSKYRSPLARRIIILTPEDFKSREFGGFFRHFVSIQRIPLGQVFFNYSSPNYSIRGILPIPYALLECSPFSLAMLWVVEDGIIDVSVIICY